MFGHVWIPVRWHLEEEDQQLILYFGISSSLHFKRVDPILISITESYGNQSWVVTFKIQKKFYCAYPSSAIVNTLQAPDWTLKDMRKSRVFDWSSLDQTT